MPPLSKKKTEPRRRQGEKEGGGAPRGGGRGERPSPGYPYQKRKAPGKKKEKRRTLKGGSVPYPGFSLEGKGRSPGRRKERRDSSRREVLLDLVSVLDVEREEG